MYLFNINWEVLSEITPRFCKEFKAEYESNNGFVPYETGYVYVIEAVGSNYFKIGKSINPDKRILQIATKMPFPLRFVRIWQSCFMSLSEKTLHKDWEEFRVNGEWFEFDEECLCSLLGSCSSNRVRYSYCQIVNSMYFGSTEPSERRLIGETFGEDLGQLSGPYLFLDHEIFGSYALAFVEALYQSLSTYRLGQLPQHIRDRVITVKDDEGAIWMQGA